MRCKQQNAYSSCSEKSVWGYMPAIMQNARTNGTGTTAVQMKSYGRCHGIVYPPIISSLRIVYSGVIYPPGLDYSGIDYPTLKYSPPPPPPHLGLPPQSQPYIKHNHVNSYCIPHTKHSSCQMNTTIWFVSLIASKDDKHRTWPRRVEESKDKEAKMAYHKKCESKTLPLMTVFCLRRTGGRSMRLKRCRLCELRIKAGTE